MSTGLGWTLGDYVIGRAIDSGKFGTVYEATHVPSGRDVALKLIPLRGLDADEKVDAERHGAMLQERFCQSHHCMVPAIYEHHKVAEFYAIAMELVRGQQLTDLINAGPLPSRRAAEIALTICTFLERAHRFETEIEGVRYALIVHADLKPDHILLLEQGGIRVLDFGIAKALAARTLVTTNKWGSVHYASPERLQSDGHVNEHVDFWSLGVMLFEMVAGFRPYRRYEHNVSRLDGAIRRQETREPLPTTADPVLATIIHKLLASQIERRYASADLIARDLHAFLHGGTVAAAAEHGQASQDTIRIGSTASLPRRTSDSPPTEPLPARAAAPAVAQRRRPHPFEAMRAEIDQALMPWRRAFGIGRTRAKSAAASPAAITPRPPSKVSSAARIVVTSVLTMIVTLEGLGLMRAARLGSQVSSIEVADLPSARETYWNIHAWSPLGIGVGLGLRDALKLRALELADRAVVAYRLGSAPVAQAQWEQARDSLNVAAEIAPGDHLIRARRAYVRGQLARIAARDGSGIDEAVRAFQESATLDGRWPDPYLGLARIYAYSSPDLDALTRSIHEAERRGYKAGRRERAQFGDVHKIRADKARAAAAKLTGAARLQQIELAAADYAKCVEYFDGLHFFNSEENLRLCRRRLAAITPEIQPPAPPAVESLDPVEL